MSRAVAATGDASGHAAPRAAAIVPDPWRPDPVARPRPLAWTAFATAGLLALVYAGPLLAALLLAAASGLAPVDGAGAWTRAVADPRWAPALAMSVFTALTSTLLSLGLALVLVSALHGTRAWTRLVRRLGAALAVPHAAFAIGLALLVMPAGWLARLIAPLAGWSAPPDWVTVHDPWGWALIAALVGKELPFLLWSIAALFARPEVAGELRRSVQVGRSLGHGPGRLWGCVLWPRWLPHLGWPVLAVLAYSLTVVDVALVLGPTRPPTLAVLAWQALTEGEPARQAEGLALAWLLTGTLVGLAALLAAGSRLAGRTLLRQAERGPAAAPGRAPGRRGWAAGAGPALAHLGTAGYVAVLAALALASVSGVWRFPALWPQQWSLAAWAQVGQAAGTVGVTAALALASAGLATALVIAWLEFTPARWDAPARWAVLAPLVLPQLVLMAGLYRLALAWRLDGTAGGLLWAHALMVLPYVFVSLAPAWRSVDPRWALAAAALGRSRWHSTWRVKLPMLRGPIAAALAVGVAVSVAQYLSTQFLGAGRWRTLTTEAVTLAADGQRLQAAALALLQALLPVLAFGAAARAAAGAVSTESR